jgi:dipeptidyl aminopeptidase/acylaminoacyl peptidase
MRSLCVLLLFGAVAHAAAHPFGVEELLKLKRLGEFDVSPDGKWLAYAVTTPNADENKSTSAIWIQPLDGSQAARPITAGTKKDKEPRFAPDGKRIAFISDRDGAPQIFVLDLAGGEPRVLSSWPAGLDGPHWSPDGKWILASGETFADCKDVACVKARVERQDKAKIKARVVERLLFRHWDAWRDGKRSHLFAVDTASGEARDLTPGDLDAPPFTIGGGPAYDIAPDGKSIVFAATHERNEALSTNDDVYELAVSGGPMRCLSCANPGRDTMPRYSPDGKFIVWTTQKTNGHESDKIDLLLHERRSGAQKILTSKLDAWTEEPAFSHDSQRIVFAAVIAGRKRILAVDVAKGTIETIIVKHANSDPRPLADGSVLFSSSALDHPAELFHAPMTPAGEAQQLTHLNDFRTVALGQIHERHVKLPDVTDELVLHAFVILPPGFDAKKKYPAILFIHGGPEGAWEDSWSYRWNPEVLASAGYVVYLPNPRGSTGYGQAYIEGVLHDWGGKAFQDLMRAADDLESLPFVDEKRIGAAGASYGGFMINWIQGHTKRFAALFCHDGIADQESMYATDELFFAEAEMSGPPWTSAEYRRWSPMVAAKDFATPELIVHGEKDYRVPVEQGYLMFSLLQRRGIPSRLIVFPDENHWVLKPGNARLWYASMIDWFHRYLGGAAADPRALDSVFSVTK